MTGISGNVPTSPGGSTTQVQYNNAGAFGGVSGVTSNGTILALGSSTATTQSALDNSTKLATTAYVNTAAQAGTYTPTGTGIAQVSVITPNKAFWTRVNNIVTVFGSVVVTASGSGVSVEFSLTLPVASDLTAVEDLVGLLTNNDDKVAGSIVALTATDKADCYFTSGSVSGRDYTYSFRYEVK